MRLFSINDVTLRDGNHALRHKLTKMDAVNYAKRAIQAGIDYLEVGHGNGLGGSSILVGESEFTDLALIEEIRSEIPNINLGVHVMPSFATIKRDLVPAIELGVGSFRIASHCTEANTTRRQIEFIRSNRLKAIGTLMMISHTSQSSLISQAKEMITYGAQEIMFMDSTGSLLPTQVRNLISSAVKELGIPVGFHAHNNLNLAVGNSLEALYAGAKSVDGTICGLGAGAGNAQLEVLVCALNGLEIETQISLEEIMKLAMWAVKSGFVKKVPIASPISSLMALNKLFSGFLPLLEKYSEEYQIDIIRLILSLGDLNLVAGQEDQIRTTAQKLADKE